jgi:iron complex outermembrane receptor protein
MTCAGNRTGAVTIEPTFSRGSRAAGGWCARKLKLLHATSLVVGVAVSQSAFGQSATPGSTISLDPINVEAQRRQPQARPQAGTPRRAQATAQPAEPAETTAQGPATVQQRFDALPGGVALIPQSNYQDVTNLTVSRALATAPGVVVQDFFGGNDQPRIQIRGSGLQQNPVERGILVLQNGLPINRADGSYIVGFANPRQAESIEVYRGYMANRLGATVLGGAINFVSPTGSTQPGVQIMGAVGSFGQRTGQAQVGFKQGSYDGLIEYDINKRDGYRFFNNSSDRQAFSGNVGIKHNENVSTRIFAGYTDLGFDVAGPLTRQELLTNPRQVHGGPQLIGGTAINPGPNVIRDVPRREASQFLVGSRTTATFGPHLLDFALGYTRTDDTFRFPISSGIRVTNGGDFTALTRYAFNPMNTVLPLFEATAQVTTGSADRTNYINQAGMTGAMFGASELSATTTALYAAMNIPFWSYFTLSPAISYAHATRDNNDIFSAASRPSIMYNPANPTALLANGSVATQSTTYSRSYDGWTPSLAVSYRPDAVNTLFTALSGSFEPPTQDDLLATANSTPNSSPGRVSPASTIAPFVFPDLRAQTATTLEGGWRGRTPGYSWDAVVYYSWVKNELLSLRDASGAPLGAINADRTTHFGVELGAGAQLWERVTGRLAYVYQEFYFDNDPVRSNNRLAGAPRHVINATLQYEPIDLLKLQAILKWVPEKTPVDNMNSMYADPYSVVDLRAEYKISPNVTMFGEVTNVFNKNYASSTLIVDVARPDQAVFLPGDGRGYFGGLRAKF